MNPGGLYRVRNLKKDDRRIQCIAGVFGMRRIPASEPGQS